jgi:hypothetical protein
MEVNNFLKSRGFFINMSNGNKESGCSARQKASRTKLR